MEVKKVKVSKWVDMGADVEVEISAEDIRVALDEMFEEITHDRLGEDGPSCGEVTRALNGMARFLNALTDEHIARLTDGQRKTVHTFLGKAAERFHGGPHK
jgi:hypothetical protein